MKSWLKNYLWPLVAAAAITTLMSVIFQTQRVLSMLGQAGADIPLSKRLSMTIYDVQHLGTVFGIFILLAFLVAMTIALFIGKKLPKQSLLLHIVAGAMAMLVLLQAMNTVFFGMPIIAGTRDALGMVGQILAGGLGGYIFYRLRRTKFH